MKLNISKDAPNSGEITLEKFFQFNIIGNKKSDNRHQIDTFNAICFKTEIDTFNAKIDCEVIFTDFGDAKGKDKAKISFSDRVRYFDEISILQQFWGEESYRNDNREDFIKQCLIVFEIEPTEKDALIKDVELIYETLDKNSTLPLIINEDKDGVTPFILLPFSAKAHGGNKVRLEGDRSLKSLTILRDKIALGFWFQKTSNVVIKNQLNSDVINSEIIFNSKFKSPDFKIYYQIGNKVDVKKNLVSIKGGEDSSLDAEIVRVYSQSEITYFHDWAELGIYNSALLRLQNSTKVNKQISIEVKSVSSELLLEDVEATQSKEVHVFILSIFISVLISMGLDATRLASCDFTFFFPDIPIITESLIWLFVCGGFILKHLIYSKVYLIKENCKRVIKSLAVFVCFWVFCCFFIEKKMFTEWEDADILVLLGMKFSHWIQFFPLIDIVLSLYLFFSLIFYRYYEKNNRNKEHWFTKILKNFFGVR
ncbi:hypothetical protein H5202_13245 [Shewanella sp. SG41-4]|uniref:hypothetical protein n=1 Tax=Shewanella sp. SG41-4 TaxID=2760976 RepID=UPI001601FEEF|nr:hypothetical protein [Shewanella sp. SG41-4]MBB1439620.1 hypothetical protein [Shewanella sp. SG41-4]